MMLGAPLNNRWKHQWKPGQAVPCRVVAKAEGGYSIEFGPDRLKGFLPCQSAIVIGTEMLLQFLGYRNQVPVFSANYGLHS